MLQPDKRPQPHAAPPAYGGSLPHDDIEIPALDEAPQQTAAEPPDPNRAAPPIHSHRPRRLLWGLALAGILAAGAWLASSGSHAESSHPNWQKVEAATAASQQQARTMFLQRDATGDERLTSQIELTLADADTALTSQVRQALVTGDLVQANALLQAAGVSAGQRSPELGLGLSSAALEALRDGRAQFYRLSLADSCDADGDVVSFTVSGQSTVVPISHEGYRATLLLTPGANVITLRGEYDGGGGITVMAESSQGHYLSRTMAVGEECSVPVVVK